MLTIERMCSGTGQFNHKIAVLLGLCSPSDNTRFNTEDLDGLWEFLRDLFYVNDHPDDGVTVGGLYSIEYSEGEGWTQTFTFKLGDWIGHLTRHSIGGGAKWRYTHSLKY